MNDLVTPALDELTPELRFQRDLTSYAHEQDLMKHLATLSTGSIVVLATFLEKLFTHPTWKGLVVVTFAGFAISVLGTVSWQLLSLLHMSAVRRDRARLMTPRIIIPVLSAALGGFLLGIVTLAVFGIRNLWPGA